jgi:hypothetical protein
MYNPDYLNKLKSELEQRLYERYREGVISESLAEYFEYGEDIGYSYDNISMREQEELARILSEKRREATFRGEPAFFAQNSDQTTYPPHTNRGVTFNESQSLSLLGGYDGGIELGFSGNWEIKKYLELKKELENHKAQALSCNKISYGSGVHTFELNNKAFIMKAKSAEAGGVYRYVIEGEGVRIYIHSNPKGDIQPVRVHYLAVGLIGRDFFHKHSEIREFIESLGFEITGEKLSRVDMQVMVKIPVSEFIKAHYEQRVVTPAQLCTIHSSGKRAESMSVGSELRVSIYDKRKELKKQLKSDPVKVALMLENVLGKDFFETDTPLTRVEFQLHRSVLRDFGINSVQDLLEHETAIARYCSNKYFRILAEPKKQGHTSEQKTSEIWLQVQSQFLSVFSDAEGHRQEIKRDTKRPVRCSADHLTAQLLGCGATAAVLQLGHNADFITVLQYILESVGNGAVKMFNRYKERSKELASRVYGAGLETFDGCCASFETVRAEINKWLDSIKPTVQLELEF